MFGDIYVDNSKFLDRLERKKQLESKKEQRCPRCNSEDFSQTVAKYSEFVGAMSSFMDVASPKRVCNKCGASWKVNYDKLEDFDFEDM